MTLCRRRTDTAAAAGSPAGAAAASCASSVAGVGRGGTAVSVISHSLANGDRMNTVCRISKLIAFANAFRKYRSMKYPTATTHVPSSHTDVCRAIRGLKNGKNGKNGKDGARDGHTCGGGDDATIGSKTHTNATYNTVKQSDVRMSWCVPAICITKCTSRRSNANTNSEFVTKFSSSALPSAGGSISAT